jgi:hypothetical protein
MANIGLTREIKIKVKGIGYNSIMETGAARVKSPVWKDINTVD